MELYLSGDAPPTLSAIDRNNFSDFNLEQARQLPPDFGYELSSDIRHRLPAIDELAAFKQWVVWRKEYRHNKPTKVPYQPMSPRLNGPFAQPIGYRASSVDRGTWGTYWDADWSCGTSDYNGVGFMFSNADPFLGIDLDHSIDQQGQLDPHAREIIDRFGSYTEVSPSGRGVEIFCRGSMPGSRCRKDTIEMYDHKRYFTVTGQHLPGTPTAINDAQPAIDWLYKSLFGDDGNASVAGPGPVGQVPPNAADDRVIEQCRKGTSRQKFEQLWAGDTSNQSGDHSAADFALCCMLARYTQDKSQIERIFGDSGLATRKKWRNRPDYRNRTIQKALQVVAGSPIGTEQASRNDPTDMGNGYRFSEQFRDTVRYCDAHGKWFYFDGRSWREDSTRHVERLAKLTALSILDEAKATNDENERRQLAKWAIHSQSEQRLLAMLNLARSELSIQPGEFDKDNWLLAVQNGVIDLRQGTLLAHNASRYITKISPVDWIPDATCPVFDAFITRIFEGNAGLIEYVERSLGWCLTGDISHQILLMFHGGGANGKSTLLDLVMYLMGEHATVAPDSLLTAQSNDQHPTEFADLQGRRLVVASETDEGKRMRLGVVKRTTGDEMIKCRRMRRDFFSFRRTHKTILVTNNRPRIPENTNAIWRRIKLVPFNVIIPDDQQDKGLLEKLKSEASGILARLVRACLRMCGDNLSLREPPEVNMATDAYRQDEDPLTEFLEKRFVLQSGGFVSRTDLWNAYQDWVGEQGNKYPLSQRGLYERLRKVPGIQDGDEKQAGQKVRGFQGLESRIPWLTPHSKPPSPASL